MFNLLLLLLFVVVDKEEMTLQFKYFKRNQVCFYDINPRIEIFIWGGYLGLYYFVTKLLKTISFKQEL